MLPQFLCELSANLILIFSLSPSFDNSKYLQTNLSQVMAFSVTTKLPALMKRVPVCEGPHQTLNKTKNRSSYITYWNFNDLSFLVKTRSFTVSNFCCQITRHKDSSKRFETLYCLQNIVLKQLEK